MNPNSWLAVPAGLLACACTDTASRLPEAPSAANIADHPEAHGFDFHYQVRASEGASELDVTATFVRPLAPNLVADVGMEGFVTGARVLLADGDRSLGSQDGVYRVPECAAGSCQVRYRFELGRAADAFDRWGLAARHADGIIAPPSTWLLRPERARDRDRYAFRVELPEPLGFVSGFPQVSPSTYMGPAVSLSNAPYAAFGSFRERVFESCGARLEIAQLPGRLSLSESDLSRWMTHAARAITAYFGRFPVERVLLLVLPEERGRLFATQMGDGGAAIVLSIPQELEARALDSDWILTHELVHLALPTLSRNHLWFSEGAATYLEPVARARAGQLDPEQVWHGFLRGMPRGLPKAGDQGLHGTEDWGRVYWGGAIFFLLADIEIQEKTSGARSLVDALRAVLEAGGDTTARWSIERVLEIADRATGVSVMSELYARHATAAAHVNLETLWDELGLKSAGERVVFDETAPLAGVRRRITVRRKEALEPCPAP